MTFAMHAGARLALHGHQSKVSGQLLSMAEGLGVHQREHLARHAGADRWNAQQKLLICFEIGVAINVLFDQAVQMLDLLV
jgi:hypothetical protein